MRSPPSSARAAWARSIAPPTPGSSARWRSRCCRRRSPKTRNGWPDSNARRKLLAQLNHPNIAQIYGLETSGAAHALVMELVPGPTLAERLESGPLSLAESLSFALQIAQALEEAHEKGIIHRDLKPQNVKAPSEGKAKVLDFGLAKAMDPATRRRLRGRSRALADDHELADPHGGARHATRGHPRHGGLHGARAGARRARSTSGPTSGRSASCSTRC